MDKNKVVGVVIFILFIIISAYAVNHSMKATQDGWIRYDMKHGMVDVNGHPISLLKK